MAPITYDQLTDTVAERYGDADHLVQEVLDRLQTTPPEQLRAEYVAADQYLLAFLADCVVVIREEEAADRAEDDRIRARYLAQRAGQSGEERDVLRSDVPDHPIPSDPSTLTPYLGTDL